MCVSVCTRVCVGVDRSRGRRSRVPATTLHGTRDDGGGPKADGRPEVGSSSHQTTPPRLLGLGLYPRGAPGRSPRLHPPETLGPDCTVTVVQDGRSFQGPPARGSTSWSSDTRRPSEDGLRQTRPDVSPEVRVLGGFVRDGERWRRLLVPRTCEEGSEGSVQGRVRAGAGPGTRGRHSPDGGFGPRLDRLRQSSIPACRGPSSSVVCPLTCSYETVVASETPTPRGRAPRGIRSDPPVPQPEGVEDVVLGRLDGVPHVYRRPGQTSSVVVRLGW